MLIYIAPFKTHGHMQHKGHYISIKTTIKQRKISKIHDVHIEMGVIRATLFPPRSNVKIINTSLSKWVKSPKLLIDCCSRV